MGRRSWIIGSALAVALSLSVSLAADAVTSVTISPSSQTVAAGGTAHWTGSWTGTPPFSGYFQYGDGSANSNFNTSSYSRAFSHSYPYLCVTRVYNQVLWVSDQNGGRSGSSQVTATGGHGC